MARGKRHAWMVGLFAAWLCLAWPASAVPERDASGLREDVLGAGHEPEVVVAGGDFVGHLRLASNTTVTAAYVQVCRVGQACFAPPMPAQATSDGYRFVFSEGPGAGVRLQAGWMLGVRWIFNETTADGHRQVAFPGDAPCAGCEDPDYLVFQVQPAKSAPAAPLAWIALWLLLAVRRSQT